MAELLYSIEKVYRDYLTAGQAFNIPEYQRGYKWGTQQIEQLLNDINNFETGDDEDVFYCLQNITLVPIEKENILNVVDGQQRLTTLSLLLAFLGESDLVKKKLIYSVRLPSNDFLQQIFEKNQFYINSIFNSTDFNDFLKTHSVDYDYQDVYFMYTAFRTISQWFEHIENSVDQTSFKNKLLKNVKLIINRIEGVFEQEIFLNLNAGKVQLDGADLVRAILITRVAKQELEDYNATEVKDVVRLNERRVRIGWELDEMNSWWSKDDIKSYFQLFTKLKTGQKETIRFNQDIHPINLLYKIWAETLGEKEIKLNLFEAKNTTPLALYSSLNRLHRTLRDWFEDREIYHFLGILFAHNSNFNFNLVWKKWNEEGATRRTFIHFIKGKIQELVFGREPDTKTEEETGANFLLNKIKDYDSGNPTDWYTEGKLEKILLTLDIIDHSLKKENGIPLPFLKPKYFKNQKEDKEHIYPSTPKEIKDISTLKDPCKSFRHYIDKLNCGYEQEALIEWVFPVNDWSVLEDSKKQEKLNELKKEIHSKRPINSIGNLVLLHRIINRGFGNDYYPDKRMTVIKNTENGKYVRQHTLKVFVKQTESKNLNEWTMGDIKQNADSIHDTLIAFFNIKLEEDNHE